MEQITLGELAGMIGMTPPTAKPEPTLTEADIDRAEEFLRKVRKFLEETQRYEATGP